MRSRRRSSFVAACAPSTTVRSLRELQWSPSPAIAGAESGGALATHRLRNHFANVRTLSLFASFYLLFPNSLFAARNLFSQKRKGGGTPANAGQHRRILRCGARLMTARSSDGVPPRLSPKGISHPKGSASGQASWDAVCTGVTRLRLSQSRDAPPTPVIMPGDMMPKPPGSRLQTRPRAPPSLP